MKLFSGVPGKGHEKAHRLLGGFRAGSGILERGLYLTPGGAQKIDTIQDGAIAFLNERAEDTSLGLGVVRLS